MSEVAAEEKSIVYQVEGHLATITLNRPKSMNALTKVMKQELADLIDNIAADGDIWGLIITGSGRAFSSGTDISEFPSVPEESAEMARFSQALFNKIEALPKPVIAAINGFAVGGGFELALACDLRVMSEAAVLGFPEVKIGAVPCYGGTYRLTRLVGPGIAKELMFTGRNVKAPEALASGMVNKVAPAGEEMAAAKELMGQILANAPLSVGKAKMCVNAASELSLEDACVGEQQAVADLTTTYDLKEGSASFLEHREPHFLGK